MIPSNLKKNLLTARKDQDHEARTVEQAIAVINNNLKDITKTLEFFLVSPFKTNLSRKEFVIIYRLMQLKIEIRPDSSHVQLPRGH